MTTPQLLSVSLVAVMMAAFLWGRLRYDIVAMLAIRLQMFRAKLFAYQV